MKHKVIFTVICFCFCSLFFVAEEKSKPLTQNEQATFLVKQLPMRDLFSTLSLTDDVLEIAYTSNKPSVLPKSDPVIDSSTVDILKGNLALFSIISDEVTKIKISYDDITIEASRQEIEREIASVFVNLPTDKEMHQSEIIASFVAENHDAMIRLVKTWNGFVTVDRAAATAI
ncbi:hypothetical protein [Mangrovibacillus cuniculi]|uniref:Uncharacterized protein n=1 Tax=Mangrovibacillus cuniculi TaxID=2593652 RepID=A0A7S8CAS7_9BACI|nr:hypothetical protein [Mangrovibacillus cuniculi]QPC46533.1 hypothetical protein G8O30_05910 [Mangrovibacillus cuniculi]